MEEENKNLTASVLANKNSFSGSPIVHIERIENNYIVDNSEVLSKLDDLAKKLLTKDQAELAILKERDDLTKQLQDVLSGTTIPPNIQEKLNMIFDKFDSNRQKVKDTVANNTSL